MHTHGHRRGGKGRKRSPTYNSWRAAIERCTYPAHPRYADYGGRGITVSNRWRGPEGFANFLADLGERPIGKTLDRIKVNGNYEPGNCRWATPLQQTWNRRNMAAHQEEHPNPNMTAGTVVAAGGDWPF